MNPVYGAMNKPTLIFGVDRKVFIASLLLSAVVAQVTTYFSLGVILFLAIAATMRIAMRRDPKFPEVILATARMSRLYDSAQK